MYIIGSVNVVIKNHGSEVCQDREVLGTWSQSTVARSRYNLIIDN